MFWILTPYQVYSLQIFSPIPQVASLLIISLAIQKLFSLLQFLLFISTFAALHLVSFQKKKKMLPRIMSRIFPLCFLLGVLWIQVFESLIQVNFCEGCQLVIQFHFFVCSYLVLPMPFIGVTVLSPLSILESVSRSVVSDILRLHGLQPSRLLCPRNSPAMNTGVGCHFLLQGIFPTQGLNSGLLYYRKIHDSLNHQGSPPNHREMNLNGNKCLVRSGKCITIKTLTILFVLGSLMKLWLYKVIESDTIKWIKKTQIISGEDMEVC